MNVLGLITEYNPFHNGHMYHLEKAKKISRADYVICVMSGNFIQRGEPAIIDKWARTKMALMAGIDLIIELPFVYATSSAEYFAFGAVKILDSLGIVNSICFGSECGDIEPLDKIAEILVNEPLAYKSLLKNELNRGISFPKARQRALTEYWASQNNPILDLGNIISSSNNILGIEYLKALKRLNSDILPLTIKRVNNSYNCIEVTDTISSATAIRNLLQNTDYSTNKEILENTMPNFSFQIMQEEFQNGKGPVFIKNFENIILSTIRRLPKETIKELPYVTEGLENRIINASMNSGNYEELLNNILTKRYTETRIKRILLNILVGLKTKEFNDFNNSIGPQYIRILGFNKNGQTLLSLINKKAHLPVITKTSKFKTSCNPYLSRMLEIEAISTDLYVLGFSNDKYKIGGQEFTKNIVMDI